MDWDTLYIFFAVLFGVGLTMAGMVALIHAEEEPAYVLPAFLFGVPGVLLLIAAYRVYYA